MENENTFPMLAYTDTKFEKQIKSEIQDAHKALQMLLDTWNALGLNKITAYNELFQLVHVPDRFYAKYKSWNEGCITSINEGEPIPLQLIVAAREAKRQTMNGKIELWSIEDGTVIVDNTAAATLLASSDTWVTNIQQKKFVEACVQFVESSDFLIESMTNMPAMRLPLSPFELQERTGFLYLSKVKLSVDQMRELLKSL